MVKIKAFSDESEIFPMLSSSCSVASSELMKMNGSTWTNVLVNGKCSSKTSKENSFNNGSCSNNVSTKEGLLVNGNGTNKMAINEAITVNGRCDKMSSETVSSVIGASNAMLVNDNPTLNENCEVPMINTKCEERNGENYLNGSNTPSENGSGSSVHTSDSLCNDDNSHENQQGFIEVVSKKKRNKIKPRNHRKRPSPNLPPGLSNESIRRDSGNDKNCCEKISPPTHLSQKLPSRNFAATRSSEKSYSSVLLNGQNGKTQLRNVSPNISGAQDVTKCTKSSTTLKNCTLPGARISVDQLSTELTKSAVIHETSPALCNQSNLSKKVEMTDVSAQTDICSQNKLPPSQTDSLPSHEEAAHESEKVSSSSDYVDVEDISDASSNAARCESVAYCDSVVSNDSGRGDSEITYDESMPYCCEFPKEKTSQLIGRGGSFKYEIERKSGIKLWVYSHEYDRSLSIICMIGTGAQIEKAKDLIKERFRHVNLRQWLGFNPINPPLSEKYLPILPEGTDFMGVVSCICDPNFFWVQQYGHPHLYSLEDLERRITDHFNNVPDAPGIDNPTIGSVIAVPGVKDGDNLKWIRGWIINMIPEEEKVVVRYLDHGGDHLVPVSNIRPMRHDFFSMPFYAAQCCLYDILPTGGVWSDEALAEFTRLCNNNTCPPIVRVVYKTTECYFVSMFGYDSETNAQVDIASHLITKGFGVRPCFPATEFASELQ